MHYEALMNGLIAEEQQATANFYMIMDHGKPAARWGKKVDNSLFDQLEEEIDHVATALRKREVLDSLMKRYEEPPDPQEDN